MFQYVYPRIDSEVSKHRNHLLKSPFVIHPATGKICVPVDPQHVEDFDPDTVPTVGKLLRELEQAARDAAAGGGGGGGEGGNALEPGREWAATSLRPYVEAFEQHIKAIMADVLAKKKSTFINLVSSMWQLS
jgi:DNA primase small subunit